MLFDKEVHLKPPPLDEETLRKMRLRKYEKMFTSSELETDDKVMRRAEAEARAALEQELQDLQAREFARHKALVRQLYCDDIYIDDSSEWEFIKPMFCGQVTRKSMERVPDVGWENGSGLLNDDKYWDTVAANDRERRELERKEKAIMKRELIAMRAEEALMLQYLAEMRRLMLADEREQWLNNMVYTQRRLERERREDLTE